jgi:hypothetical protein
MGYFQAVVVSFEEFLGTCIVADGRRESHFYLKTPPTERGEHAVDLATCI